MIDVLNAPAFLSGTSSSRTITKKYVSTVPQMRPTCVCFGSPWILWIQILSPTGLGAKVSSICYILLQSSVVCVSYRLASVPY